MATWDSGLDFEKERERLRLAFISIAKDNKFKKLERRIKIAILCIALNNGARIGEAKNAYNEFIKTNNREIIIPVEKRGYIKKYKKDENDEYIHINKKRVLDKQEYIPVFRKIIIPSYINFDNYPTEQLYYNKSNENLYDFSKRFFSYNPHSLRYAFITYLGVKKGKPAQLIAKITKHSGLEQIIGYTQQKEADIILKEVVE